MQLISDICEVKGLTVSLKQCQKNNNLLGVTLMQMLTQTSNLFNFTGVNGELFTKAL